MMRWCGGVEGGVHAPILGSASLGAAERRAVAVSLTRAVFCLGGSHGRIRREWLRVDARVDGRVSMTSSTGATAVAALQHSSPSSWERERRHPVVGKVAERWSPPF
jgi:hypothetical protein